MVDLERPYPIDAVVIWNRDDDFAWRARSLRIQVSVDGERCQVLQQGRNFFRRSFTGCPLVHFLDSEVVTRSVRISLQETVRCTWPRSRCMSATTCSRSSTLARTRRLGA